MTETLELKVPDYKFLTEIYQKKGHNRPLKYVHSLEIPLDLFCTIRERGIIDMQFLCQDKTVYFEFTEKTVIISFTYFHYCNDLHIRIDNYLITEAYGVNPVKRNGQSKMNQDNEVQFVQHEFKKKTA